MTNSRGPVSRERRTHDGDPVLNVLIDHAVDNGYVDVDSEITVICKCGMHFEAGESHAIHQTKMLRESGATRS